MYYLLFFFCYLISLLPLKVLYLFSDFSFLVLFKIIGYRKEIVQTHFRIAFPEKSKTEIDTLTTTFYHSFCDQWIETLKLMSMPLSKLKKRMGGNWEIFDFAAEKGNGNVVVLLGHQFNWEWGNVAAPLYFSGRYAGIYLPVASKITNRLLQYIRERSGAVLIPANDLKNGFQKLKGQKHILAFIADQTPGSLKIADWYSFMNRPAPFFNGPEKVARRQHAAVVLVSLRKIHRGFYQLHGELLCTHPDELPSGAITKSYVAFLEKELRNQPPNWMWTHRRWKKTPPENQVN